MRVVLSRLTLGATSGSSHQAGSSLRIKYLRRARRRIKPASCWSIAANAARISAGYPQSPPWRGSGTRQPPLSTLAAQLTAYAADPHVNLTIHLTTNRQIGDTIESTADRLGLQDTIRVQSTTVQNIPAMAQ
ncbi:MAG TPA: hypothetical protein VGF91_15055 [Solirubrobacteraceae bacterium]|jgi:hypothetical protein